MDWKKFLLYWNKKTNQEKKEKFQSSREFKNEILEVLSQFERPKDGFNFIVKFYESNTKFLRKHMNDKSVICGIADVTSEIQRKIISADLKNL